MTKNELTKLLGIESIMKRNSKNKTYDTMLDIICDFLMISKDINGGIQIPASSQQQDSSQKVKSNIIEQDKKPSSLGNKQL